MKMTSEEIIDCINALLNILTHCDDNTEIETIYHVSLVGLILISDLKENLNDKN